MKKTILFFGLLSAVGVFAQKKSTTTEVVKPPFDAGTVGALSFRMVGPALTSGRVIDIAVNPTNKDQWYVAAACGGQQTIMESLSPLFLMGMVLIQSHVWNSLHRIQIRFG